MTPAQRHDHTIVASPSRPWESAREASAEDFALGDWASFEVRLDEQLVDAFVSLTGDRSPIHVSREYAQRAGFPQRVVHGMLMASYVSTMVGMFLPGQRAMLMSQKVDFVEPVMVGSIITIAARVSQLSPATSTMSLAVVALRGGTVVMRGSVTARVRKSA